jgi:signal peptidase II
MSNRPAASGYRAPISTPQIALRFIGWATVVLVLDLMSKHWAVTALADSAVAITDGLALFLVFNSGLAGGASIGPYTWLVNALGTLATVGMVVGAVVPLARVDRRASVAMGMVAGGALGNLTSILGEARGVPDFLALRLADVWVVFNVADIGLWLGAALLVPIVLALVRIIRDERRAANASRQAVVRV